MTLRRVFFPGLGAALLALEVVALRSQQGERLAPLILVLLAEGAVYFIAVYRVVCANDGRLKPILVVAALLRLPLLLAPPYLSNDVYRYVWDGRVQAAGVNPYRYVPAAAALEALRDDRIYPEINRRERAVTIYPP